MTTTEDGRGLEGWFARLAGEASPAGLPDNSTSQALEASRVAKSGAGTLYGFSGFNSKAAAQFILVFDAQTLPADGAIPVVIISAPASSNFSYDAGRWGRAASRGIVACNSSTSATKTLGAADCWFDVQYV